jgi:hypothetical protein
VLFAVIAGGMIRGTTRLDFHMPTALITMAVVLGAWGLISRVYRHEARPGENGSLVGRRRVELDDSAVRQVAPLHEGRTSWAGVLSVDETRTHLFLMTDTLAGYIIPRRAFSRAAEYEAFVAFARGRVDATRPRR